MLRQKPANEAAVNRLISFLKMVEFVSKGNPPVINFKSLQESEGVAKRTAADLKALDIITSNGKETIWNIKAPSNFRILALQILDYRLKKTKKQIHVPIPTLEAISNTLQTISERLTYIAAQSEVSLNRTKTRQAQQEEDLFSKQTQLERDRVYIAGKVASAIYSLSVEDSLDPNAIRAINKNILFITDDLLKQLNNNGKDK